MAKKGKSKNKEENSVNESEMKSASLLMNGPGPQVYAIGSIGDWTEYMRRYDEQ